MIKILITGPECSGKTTLAKSLAEHFRAALVPELSRIYLTLKDGKYQEDDLVALAAGQDFISRSLLGLNQKLHIHDTSWIVFKIWSQYKFATVNDRILAGLEALSFDHILLCQPTAEYAADPLRENHASRWSLYYLYHKELFKRRFKYEVLSGSKEERLARATASIAYLLT